MKRTLFYILFFASLCGQNLTAAELEKIARVDSLESVQIYFTFDFPPKYSDMQSERRIDLTFLNTSLSPGLEMIEADGNIVKILSRSTPDKITISLFFRYKPQKYSLRLSSDNNNIVFDVLLGNEYSRTYRDLADRLQGLTVERRVQPDTVNPYQTTPYTRDWMSFFALHESPVQLSVPVSFNLPPFPVIALLPPDESENLSLFGSDMIRLAEQGLWDNLSGHILLRLQHATNLREQKLLALTYGETLTRSGDFTGAFKQLYLLKNEFKDEMLGTFAAYLLALLRCMYEDPYLAYQEFLELDPLISPKNPLAPYFLLSKIEAALTTKDAPALNSLLLSYNVALPAEVAEKVTIRQADYWYLIDKPIQAFASYRLLLGAQVLDRMPWSLAGLSNTLYDQKEYELASKFYRKLAALVADKQSLGLVNFRKSMADLKFRGQATLVDNFSQIENSFPGTEAGYRAAMKKTDLLYLADRAWGAGAMENYRAIAREVTMRPIREEALLKQAVIHAQLGENDQAIEIIEKLLREFLTGNLRTVTQALLIDILPERIKALVNEKKYMEALVLAKKNRFVFDNNWVDKNILVEIAEAYNRIGIYDEAQRLYLYLIEISSVEQKENYYLPMIRATFDHGNFNLVDQYAARYFYNYPKGEYADDILFLRLQALVADGRIGEAIKLMPERYPRTKEFYEFAAMLYFRSEKYEKCIEILDNLKGITPEFSRQQQFIYAESLYLTGRFTEAMEGFAKIDRTNEFYEQSLYRLAQFARNNGDEKKALTLFKKIVETGKDSHWKKYAERELRFAETAAAIQY